MSHITLIRPPVVCTKHVYSAGITPPLGPAYLAGSLRAAGHRVAAIDAVGDALTRPAPGATAMIPSAETDHKDLVFEGLSTNEILARIDASTDGIGVSVMYSQQWPHVDVLIAAIAERFPGKPIFVGGEHVTGTWQYILESNPAVTACAVGEGEETIVDLAEHLDGRIALEEIPGLAIRRGGQAFRTPPRARIRDVAGIPRPAWDLLPIEAYIEGGFSHGVYRGRTMPILATRGCPYQCTFCSNKAMWTQRYYVRDVADVVDEIEGYTERYGAQNIDFYDLTAIIKRSWILDFCNELDRRGISITYQLPSGTRAEALDAEVLAALHRTGCRNICYAPESGSKRTLDRILKKASAGAIRESIRAAKQIGIIAKVNLMIGLPGETRADVWRTVAYGARLAWIGADDIPLFPFSPYPGTQLYEELRASGRVPPMSNDYFATLGYMDLSRPTSFSEHIGGRELWLVRTLGMIAYIVICYARRPWRIWRTLKNVASERCETVVEQRLIDLKRRRLGRAKTQPAPLPGGGQPRTSQATGA